MTYLLVTLGGILTGWSISSLAGVIRDVRRIERLNTSDHHSISDYQLEWDRFTSGGRRG
jgi:hypothetical protein